MGGQFFHNCGLKSFFISIELRRNLAESKQRKKATVQTVAFFLDPSPVMGFTFPVRYQLALFIR
ncbi:hypothetical protein E0L21_23405 [Kosakonia quasisacchari]|uniref:Uncharacterized protein n=1 Tax=Kosakonia quasisacchari TaxID=2529380 RepID=A0A4R0GI83_9ENTR|nr:hypothetical protein E0L21_23405 [Kosakonia quasisacchari]